MKSGSILIIDDEENLRRLMARIITLEGYHVTEASSCSEGLKSLVRENIAVVITDVKLPDGNGVDLTAKIKAAYPAVEVIVLTAYGTIQDGVKAMKNGAFDYLTKGDHQDKLIPLINKACEKSVLQHKIKMLEEKLTQKFGFENIIGRNKQFLKAVEMARRVASSDAIVLLLGETGVGKEVFAQAIHYESNRKSRPIVALNCSAFPKDLLESELFGHAEGAFTGAVKSRKGLMEEADGGTLFLDELAEMNLDLQAKLLRVLETGEFYRVGDSRLKKVDVRIIAATNKELNKEIENGHFRQDLFYRLSVFMIDIPPLRERREDIPLIADHFNHQFSLKTNKKVKTLSEGFLKYLNTHLWKGNIRELKNVMERCVILSDTDTITPDLLPSDFNMHEQGDFLELAAVEKRHIARVLKHTEGNKTEAARLLNIGLTTLYRKIEEYQIG
jgi:two-component system NtrC family response regulator